MEARLRVLEERLIAAGVAVRRGGDNDLWDLEVRTGSFAAARLIGTVEEHGYGSQMVRWRLWPRWWLRALVAALVAGGIAAWALTSGAFLAVGLLLVIALVVVVRVALDAATALAATKSAARP